MLYAPWPDPYAAAAADSRELFTAAAEAYGRKLKLNANIEKRFIVF